MLEGGNLVEHVQADIKVMDVDLILPLCFNDDESLIWPGLLFFKFSNDVILSWICFNISQIVLYHVV